MATAAELRTAYTVADTVTGGDLPPGDMGVLLGTKGTFILQQALPTTAATTAAGVAWMAAPFAFTVDDVEAFLATADDAAVTIDINDGGTTILSTKLTIDANETSSATAAAAEVISDTTIAKGSTITVDIDAGTAPAAGLTVLIHYTRTA